jgi:hypothetical protein
MGLSKISSGDSVIRWKAKTVQNNSAALMARLGKVLLWILCEYQVMHLYAYDMISDAGEMLGNL